MVLIADSGSTKTEWCIIPEEGTPETLITSGINPFYQEAENISVILKKEFTSLKKFDAIYFYGAGCCNQQKTDIVREALLDVFDTNRIFVGSDLLAAARSLCLDQPGIACILGTGSNSCFYDGNTIIANVSPLGFILGDEGSGAVLGKKLVGDILKNQLPRELVIDFFETYQTTAEEIMENVYRKPFPNRYMARYTRFLSKNIQHPEIENIVLSGFRDFVLRNLLQYPQINRTAIHFIGSTAFHFETQLRKIIKEQNLVIGNIENTPMKGLISYHKLKFNL